MRISDYLRLGWDQLRRRKVVTALCAIGIAIGSASIIVALAFGESVTHYTQERMAYHMKTDELTVYPGYQPNEDGEGGTPVEITEQKLDIIRSLDHVKAAAKFQQFGYYSYVVDETKHGSLELVATDLEQLEAFGMEFQQGAPADTGSTVILSYGATVDLYDERAAQIENMRGGSQDGRHPWDQPAIAYPLYRKTITLMINEDFSGTWRSLELPVQVVGILKKPDNLPDNMIRSDRKAYISPELANKISEFRSNGGSFSGYMDSGHIRVKVDQTKHVNQVEELIRKLNLNVNNNLYQQERMQEEFLIVRLLLGGVGMFVLLVASISIVVAMTMSTYQRRRQIGIMKVLGSNLKQIRNMFIIESGLLGILGGALGILISYWVIWGINVLVIKFDGQGAATEVLFIKLWILPVGMFFALLTGILSGMYPAVKASRTDALTAIKRD